MKPLLLLLLVSCAAADDDPKPDAATAIAALEKIGASIERDDKEADKPVVAVDFYGTKAKSAALVDLEAFPQLRKLNLYFAEIGDEGLAQPQGADQPAASLDLGATRIGDKGVPSLKGLTNLRYLSLSYTHIGDKGMATLKGMTKLETLKLSDLGLGDEALASRWRA